jgi:hypothetical protein
MKFFDNLKTTGLGLVTGLALLGANLNASAQQETFQTTNNLVSGTQYTLYPTNTANTGTGLGISMQTGYKTVGIHLSGDVINSNSAPIGLSLVRAGRSATSGITNWETTAVYKPLITVPVLTNHFDWMTNLPEDFTGAGYKLGISQLTNNFTTGCNISNLVIEIIKKPNTIAYP